MRSLRFPDMFNSNSTNIVKDFTATKQNTFLLLNSEKGELSCDPYFGIRLKRYLFNQNNYILKDILIDEIYTQVALFMPQLKINRNDIKILSNVDGKMATLTCSFKATNQANFTVDTYSLILYQSEEQ